MVHDWESTFIAEIDQANAARQAGKEGMARVCARRAAGIVAAEYLRRRSLPNLGPSVYERLKYLKSLDDLPAGVPEVIEHFLIRVRPDHTLPVDADLIDEAHWLADALLEKRPR